MFNFKTNISILFLVIFFSYKFSFCYEYVGFKYPKNYFPIFRVNQTGTPDCSGEFTAIQNAIQTWNNVTTTYIDLQYGTTTTSTAHGYNGTNLIRWVESGWDDIFPEHENALAVNSTWVSGSTALESDIFFNGEDYLWSDNGAAGRYDVQNVATHEIGHSVGLADLYGGGDTEKTMYYASSTGETKKSTLDIDDEDGARYVNFEAQTSGTLLENQVWLANLNSNVNLSNNLTVPSNKTLTIRSTAIVNLVNGANRYSIISTGGTITKEAGATINGLRAKLKDPYEANYKGYCGLIQTACSNADSLDEIYIEEGTFDENLSISNVYGVKISGIYNETVINGTISATNCYAIDIGGFDCNGIYLNVCPFGLLVGINVLGDGSGNGCSLYYVNNQPGNIEDLTVWNFLTGFYFFRTKWYVDDRAYDTETWILDNGRSVYAYNANVTLVGTSMCGISSYHLYARMSSVVNAYNCYFDDANPQVYSSSSQVYVSGSTDCEVNYKSAPNDNHLILTKNSESDNPIDDDFNRINNGLNSLALTSSQDRTSNGDFNIEKYYDDYINVTDSLKYFMKNYPSSVYSETALVTAMYCFERILDYKKMKLFLDDIINDKKLSNLHRLAERYLMNYYMSQKDYNSAIFIADENIQALKSNEDLLCDFLYAKGLIYAHNINQSKDAIESFLTIVNNYPDNSLVELAKNELLLLGIEAEEKTNFQTTTNENKEFNTSSYPNPFNPTTTINYTLPTDELVMLKVYDILGREVTTLVNEVKQAGTYSVNFDASNLASGIYFYTISAGKFHQTKKMLLLR